MDSSSRPEPHIATSRLSSPNPKSQPKDKKKREREKWARKTRERRPVLCLPVAPPMDIQRLRFKTGARRWTPTQSETDRGPYLYIALFPDRRSCIIPPRSSSTYYTLAKQASEILERSNWYRRGFRSKGVYTLALDASCCCSKSMGLARHFAGAVNRLTCFG